MKNINNFDVSKILIEWGSSSDIMYAELFKKLRLRKENISPYMASDLEEFKDIVHAPGDI